MKVPRFDYLDLAVRYNLGSLQAGADLFLGDDGDLAMTLDGDLKIGNVKHNALHRLLVRWQMEGPVLEAMFETVFGSEEQKRKYEEMIEALLTRKPLSKETAEDFAKLQELIGMNEYGPGNYAGAVAVSMNSMLRREWVDLGKPSRWKSAGEKVAGHSFGQIVEALSNNYRHADEWARAALPDAQQLGSMVVLADVLGATLAPDGRHHPFRSNVCPKIWVRLTGGSFTRAMDRFFDFARALAGL